MLERNGCLLSRAQEQVQELLDHGLIGLVHAYLNTQAVGSSGLCEQYRYDYI